MHARRLLLALTFGSAACGPVEDAVDARHVRRDLRPTEVGSSEPRYPPGVQLESFARPDGRFRVHYTSSGPDAVPLEGVGVPAYVRAVADTYEEALSFYERLGFRRPLSDGTAGGDDRVDVYLVDFGGRGDGAFVLDDCPYDNQPCFGHIRHENDFAGYGYPSLRIANRILASHELFHAVQSAYATGQTVVLTEGSAVWATETFDPSLSDFEGFIDGYLGDTGRSLDFDGGAFDGFGYGTGIFFQFLAEWVGPDLVRELWEAVARAPEAPWLTTLDQALEARGRTFSGAFATFSEWNLRIRTGGGVGYRGAETYPPVRARPVESAGSERPRLFPASMQVLDVPVAGPEFEVAFGFRPDDDASPQVSLRTTSSNDDRSTWSALERASEPLAPVRFDDLSSQATVQIAIVNTSTGGASARPTLCWGDEASVTRCLSALGDPSSGIAEPTPPPPVGADGEPPIAEGCSSARQIGRAHV